MNFDRRRAVAALTAAGLLWGTTVPLSKLALGWLAPGWLTFVRFGFAAAILLPAARHRLRAACTLPVLAAGAAGYGGSVVVQNAGITRTSVSHAALLVGAVPVLVAVIAALWHRAVARPVAWAGFAVSLAGIGLVTGGGGGGATVMGDGLVLTSLLLSATFTVAQTRLLHGRDPVAVTAVQFLGAALAVLPFSVATEGKPGVPGGPGAPLAALAVIGLTAGGTLLPFTLFAYAQSRVSAEVAGAFLNLEPLVGAVAGVAIFGDPAGLRQLAGGAAILAGIALGSLPLFGTGRRPAPGGGPPPGRHGELQQSMRELRRPTPVPGPAARRCSLAAGSPASAGPRYGRACGYARRPACWPGRRRRASGPAQPRFPCWSRPSRPGPWPTAAVRAHRNEVRLRRLHMPNATSAAARTAQRAALASRCGRGGVSGSAMATPRRRARPSPPSRINSSWFHLNAGRATGASRFIHRLVV